MEVLVEKFRKGGDGIWMLNDYRSLDNPLTIESIDYQTTLAELYRDVVFEEGLQE